MKDPLVFMDTMSDIIAEGMVYVKLVILWLKNVNNQKSTPKQKIVEIRDLADFFFTVNFSSL